MTAPSSLSPYARVMRHFASTRWLEILALQASPLLGGVLGGFVFSESAAVRFALLLLGSLALTAHVFVFNDWAGHRSDSRDPRRAPQVFGRQGISRLQVVGVSTALLLVANLLFAVIGLQTLLLGAAIAALSLLYSCSPSFGKSTPLLASLNHLLGGALHFLLGYSLFHSIDAHGLLLSLFFGLVFAAGHLNQEVRDEEGDSLNGIRTCAVAYGCRPTFLASFFVFTLAYLLLAGLSFLGVLPSFLILGLLLWPLQLFWTLQALRRGLGFETAVWMQARYRMLFALVGLAMLFR